MIDYLSQSFDFGIRTVQLVKWLKDEGKDFPLSGRLLECGTGVGVSLRVAKSLDNWALFTQAFMQAEEVQFLLELMVKTDFITKIQSEPLILECKSIKNVINEKELNKPQHKRGMPSSV